MKLITLLVLLQPLLLLAQDDYVKQDLKYDNRVYQSSIKTVQLRRKGFDQSDAMIELGGAEQLLLSFDNLSRDLKSYNYTFIHCDSNWEPDRLTPAEYTAGFAEDIIRSYKYSFNTSQGYIHYETTLPNEYVQITKSGNYLLKVYENYDVNNLVLTYRFIVVDNQINVSTQYMRSGVVSKRNTHQEIDFKLDYGKLNIASPFSDLKVVLMKNNDWNEATRGLQPTFLNGTECTYSNSNDNSIAAGNDYREFDFRNFRYTTQFVNTIEFDTSNHYNVYLQNDALRSKRYFYKGDLNGKYLINSVLARNPETDADYAYVRFYYPRTEPFKDGELYIYGQLSNFAYTSENKLTYDKAMGAYYAKMTLKQGYYNYEYRLVKYGETTGDASVIEGDYFETENDYTLLIYAQTQGKYYDQLLGYYRMNTTRGQ